MSSLSIPPGLTSIVVKAINLSTPETQMPAAAFMSPIKPGHENYYAPVYAFLLAHPSGKNLLFDLGPRKDFGQSSPAVQAYVQFLKDAGFRGLVNDADIIERLAKEGIRPGDIDVAIWSHAHLDHTGDMSLFPPTTELIIGPGTDLSTYPSHPGAGLIESDLANRTVTTLNEFPLKIGDLEAIDYFNDGSLYLVNAPGHMPGHITALVRVTPTTFVLLGADSCHHAGQLRPNTYCPCPSHIHVPSPNRDEPLLDIPSAPSAYADADVARKTLRNLMRLDANEDILMLLAHDSTVVGVIDEFPKDVNSWKEKGWKEQTKWAFLDESNDAYRF